MPDESKSWGLRSNERLMVLGIRAAGLMLFGLGVPMLSAVIWTVYRGGWSGVDTEANQVWRIGTLVEYLQTRLFVVEFLSSTGVYLVAFVAGVYLMRCDPRPMLRSAGAKV